MKFQVEFGRSVVHVEADDNYSAARVAIDALKAINPDYYGTLAVADVLSVKQDTDARWKHGQP
jgi:hypothetical protein